MLATSESMQKQGDAEAVLARSKRKIVVFDFASFGIKRSQNINECFLSSLSQIMLKLALILNYKHNIFFSICQSPAFPQIKCY